MVKMTNQPNYLVKEIPQLITIDHPLQLLPQRAEKIGHYLHYFP
jgi:hypothetical protein